MRGVGLRAYLLLHGGVQREVAGLLQARRAEGELDLEDAVRVHDVHADAGVGDVDAGVQLDEAQQRRLARDVDVARHVSGAKLQQTAARETGGGG